MEGEIAKAVFVQYGALGLLAVSGWIVSYYLSQALKDARKELADMHDRAVTTVSANTQAMTLLAERLGGRGAA